MKVSGGEAVVRSLVEHKVKTVYGLPGSHVLDIYNFLRDERRINQILAMHEVSAAFMADAHGRLIGEPGICVVTGGPGATNAVTGIAQAYAAASPVLQIAGRSHSRKKIQPDHSVDDLNFQLKIYKPLTKWTVRIEAVEDIPPILSKAFNLATSGRPGPVYLEIPEDVLTSSGKIGKFRTKSGAESPDVASSVKRVAEILKSATDPIIAVGGGVLREFCSYEVIELAKSLCSPILTLPSAISAIPYDCPLYLGYDLAGYNRKYGRWVVHPLINSLVKKADMILTLGFDVGERLLCFKEKSGNLIHIHQDSSTKGYGGDEAHPKPIIDVETSIKGFVKCLQREVKQNGRKIESIENRISQIKRKIYEDIVKSIRWTNNPIHPGEISIELGRILDDDAIVTLDVGNSAIWMKTCYRANRPNTVLAPGRYSSMGFALPASIAAKVNFPERQVVAVTGDGSFLMSYMDFPTIVKYKLGIVVIVESNRRYGMIWQMQAARYRGRTFATEIEIPKLAEYARAFGATCIEVRHPNDLKKALDEAVNAKGPVLVDIDTAYRFPSYLPTRTRRSLRKMANSLRIRRD